jgi:RNA polymerase sigma-70 factor (ECF subfamily)
MQRQKIPENNTERLTPFLVLRLRQGDAQAARLLNETYRPHLLRFAYGYLGRIDAAEDAVQDVFCRVLENPTIPENFRAWVYRICRNRCLDILRARSRKRDDQELPNDSHLDAQITGDLTRLARREQQARLRELLAALPANQREVLRLRYTEDLSRSEIAEVLGIRESLVKSRLFEGLQKLRQHDSLQGS